MISKINSIKFFVSDKIARRLPAVLFCVSVCVFLFASLYNLTECFPCESQDEESKFRIAFRLMQVFFRQDALGDLFDMYAHPRGPFLMFNDYVGWPVLYLVVLLMPVLGKTLGYFFVFRLPSVLFGVITLFSIRYVLKRWFDDWTAALAVFFVGCNYSYIQAVHYGGFYREEILQVFGLWFGLALCCMADKRKLWLYCGFFVFGLALWTKIMFAAYIVAVAAVFVFLGLKSRCVLKDIFPLRRNAVFSGLAFLLGAAPFVWFNLTNKFPTIRLIFFRLFRFSEVHADWNNSAVSGNLLRRVQDIYLYLSGEILFGVCGDFFKPVCAALFTCACIFGLVNVFGRWGSSKLKQKLRVLFIFYAVVLVLTCFVPNRHHPGHILMLVPFPAIICAVFLTSVARIRGLFFVALLVCGLWFGEQLEHRYLFSRNYNHDAQVGDFRKADYDLLRTWIKSRNVKRVICPEPLGSLMYIVGDEREIEFYDIIVGGYSIDRIVGQISAQVSGTPVSCLLSCADYTVYSRIKESAAQYGIKMKIIDVKTLRRDSVFTFMLCRVSREERKDTNLPGRSV